MRAPGIDIADAAAVGDTYNDIPMLERVGHSFIVDNAEEHMSAHAKWRIPSNNDGGVLTLIDAPSRRLVNVTRRTGRARRVSFSFGQVPARSESTLALSCSCGIYEKLTRLARPVLR